jgi:hypothetical protein
MIPTQQKWTKIILMGLLQGCSQSNCPSAEGNQSQEQTMSSSDTFRCIGHIHVYPSSKVIYLMWLQSKSISTHTPYLGLYQCLPHPKYSVNYSPADNEQENVDYIEGETI